MGAGDFGQRNQAQRRHAERRVVSATRVRALCVSVLAVVAVWNGAVWVHGRVTTTNQLAQLTRWMDQNIPRSATIAYPEGVIQFALEGNGFPAIPLGFPNVMAADHVRYLVVIPKEIQENYTFISPQSFVFFEAHSNVVFRSATSGGEYVEVLATTNPTTW